MSKLIIKGGWIQLLSRHQNALHQSETAKTGRCRRSLGELFRPPLLLQRLAPSQKRKEITPKLWTANAITESLLTRSIFSTHSRCNEIHYYTGMHKMCFYITHCLHNFYAQRRKCLVSPEQQLLLNACVMDDIGPVRFFIINL